MRARLASYSRTPVNFAHALQAEGEEETYNRAPPPLIDLLRPSAFFEEPNLRVLAEAPESRYFCRGEPLIAQGDTKPGLWVLATGRVALNHRPHGSGEAFALRTLSNPGSIVGWAGFAGVSEYSTSVVVTRDCTVYRIDPGALVDRLTDDPFFAQALTRRLLLLVSTKLRAARALFISRRFEQEILAVRNLLEQSCTQLSVGSPLHRLPHLLESPLTPGDAFDCIEHQLAHSSDPLDRNLAQLCQDMLAEVKREHEFFDALRRVYHAVVTAPPEMPPRDVRKLCARGFRDAFRRVRCVVNGERHLPDSPGQIFIFNHLKNHEFNTLPNNFQLTLDSHFVSSVVLDRKYGDSGVRVVRKSRGTEYGHQNSYDRLGHISVYTSEADELHETTEEKRLRRNDFFDTAGPISRRGQPDPQPGRHELLDRGLPRPVQAGCIQAGCPR